MGRWRFKNPTSEGTATHRKCPTRPIVFFPVGLNWYKKAGYILLWTWTRSYWFDQRQKRKKRKKTIPCAWILLWTWRWRGMGGLSSYDVLHDCLLGLKLRLGWKLNVEGKYGDKGWNPLFFFFFSIVWGWWILSLS